VANELLITLLCVVDEVSAFWRNHCRQFPSLSSLQSTIIDFRRRLTAHSSADVMDDGSVAAAEQRDSCSSAGSDDVK